jgi:hypothetical protein
MELESGSSRLERCRPSDRRRASDGGACSICRACGLGARGERLARATEAYHSRDVGPHVDEDAGGDDGAGRS